ncbi:hypothetical protein LguiA_013660 [Lonicera macranthoides]
MMASISVATRATIFITFFLHLLSPLACLDHHHHHTHPLPSTRGLIFEEKTRLGSTPPSCHNKCNQCHPCMAVQVPTLPSQNPVHPGTMDSFYDSSAGGNKKYSNYKPLGWKCRCKDSFYNP